MAKTPTVKSIEDQFFDATFRISAANEYDPSKVLGLVQEELGEFEYEVLEKGKVKRVRANPISDHDIGELRHLILLMDEARKNGKPIRLEDMAIPLGEIAGVTARNVRSSLGEHMGAPKNLKEESARNAEVNALYDNKAQTLYPRRG